MASPFTLTSESLQPVLVKHLGQNKRLIILNKYTGNDEFREGIQELGLDNRRRYEILVTAMQDSVRVVIVLFFCIKISLIQSST